MKYEIDMTDFREALAELSETLNHLWGGQAVEPGSRVRRATDSRWAGNRRPDTALDRAEQKVRDEFDAMVQFVIVRSEVDYTDASVTAATQLVVGHVRRIYGEAIATFVTTDPVTWAAMTDPATAAPRASARPAPGGPSLPPGAPSVTARPAPAPTPRPKPSRLGEAPRCGSSMSTDVVLRSTPKLGGRSTPPDRSDRCSRTASVGWTRTPRHTGR
ncbi:hypothetical protein [Parafrankia sp. EUN1f]|uniref:hypothetical protein n=1 Tax=Parafrankia sp. EUN1f TaxID=102897 RepID=UPI0001C44A77|nr:hypothetical protein [Parafrankia sp. EUN1f]EFC84494.1 hypothetical protein FrEUN1fDRAFT_2424 [Parafrankia sp. EUN1f]